MVWQGTAEHLRAWVASGGIQGNEAAWTEGFIAWVPVSSHERTLWIREAVAQRDEFTGEQTEFSNPEGTEALNLPTFIEEGDSPFAGDRPGRERRGERRRRATDHQEHDGRSGRRDGDRRVISSVGLPVGVLAGIVIGLGAAYLLWTQLADPAQGASPAAVTPPPAPAPPVQVADSGAPIVQSDTGAHQSDVKASPQIAPKATSEAQAGTVSKASPKGAVEPSKAAAVEIQPVAKPVETKEPVAEPKVQADKKAPKVIRIVKKKKSQGIELPADSANRVEEIKRSMNVRRAIWDACIRRAQRDYPALVGRLTFSISVTKGGKINGVTGPSGNAGAQYAAGCLLGEFSNLTFPPGRAAQVKFPYTTK
jgi:hypothetical protein